MRTSFPAASGSGRSARIIPAVPAASSVTTIAFIPATPCIQSSPPHSVDDSVDDIVHRGSGTEAPRQTRAYRHDRYARCCAKPLMAGGGLPIDATPVSLDAIVQLIDAGLWATASSPRRTSSPGPSLTMTSPWGGYHIGIQRPSGSTGGGGMAAARPQEHFVRSS